MPSKKRKLEQPDDDPVSSRLKKMAYKSGLVSRRPHPVTREKIPRELLKYDNTNIINKNAARAKKRLLCMFPFQIRNMNMAKGTKFGDIQNLATNNPTMLINFPQGRLKLSGTKFNPKSKFMAMHYQQRESKKLAPMHSKGTFDTIIVFSEYYWIGTVEDNPDQTRLPFPAELKQDLPTETDSLEKTAEMKLTPSTPTAEQGSTPVRRNSSRKRKTSISYKEVPSDGSDESDPDLIETQMKDEEEEEEDAEAHVAEDMSGPDADSEDDSGSGFDNDAPAPIRRRARTSRARPTVNYAEDSESFDSGASAGEDSDYSS